MNTWSGFPLAGKSSGVARSMQRSSRAMAVSPPSENDWRWNAGLALVALMSCAFIAVRPAAAAGDVPSGTIELTGGSVAAGVGYTWSSGTLIFEGKKYSIKVEGISLLQIGASGYTASGTVYNLQKVSDIDGVYTAVSAGAALAGGASVAAMENSNGVVIQTVATHEGANLSLGPKGMTISLEKQSF
jgi:hypothetical protein